MKLKPTKHLMKNAVKVIGVLFLLIFLSSLAFAKTSGESDKNTVIKKVSGLLMPFIENQGQIKDKTVKFYANTFAGTVFVTDKGEIVYSLIKSENSELRSRKLENRQNNSELQTPNSQLLTHNSLTKAVTIKETLERPEQSEIKGINKSEIKVNYFVGGKDNWRTNISTWQEVTLGEVYKGIELKLKAYGKNVEKIFTVNPKGSVEDIKLKLEGAKSLRINDNGELEIETEIGTVKFTKPIAYQEIEGKRMGVDARYMIPDAGSKMQDNNSELQTLNSQLMYGFQVAQYDETKPLIIDPLLSSTFIGGSGDDYADALAIDYSGNVFVAGWTSSSDYPSTAGAYDTTYNGSSMDVFVSKLNSELTSLLSSTFIGGSGDDYADTLAIDSSGNVFLTGWTSSSDYPSTAGAYDTTYNGGPKDIFISRLNNDLTSLLSSTFIGGGSEESARPVAIDSLGNVFVAGWTSSSDYPSTAGAYDITFNGNPGDVFVSKLNSDLTGLLASTFIGGNGKEYARALGTDFSGNVFVAGWTSSSDYPATDSAYDTTFNGVWDVFVSKFNYGLTELLASTFIGGSTYESVPALAIDFSGNVFVTGWTSSPDYPTTAGAYDTTYNGGPGDIIVSKLNSNLTSLLSSTFIGGSNDEWGWTLAIDSSGNVFIAGLTLSSDYPTTAGAYDMTYNGGDYDVIVSRLNSDLTSLLLSTFIGGSSKESARALAIDSSGNVFVAGYTGSSDYPTTAGAYDMTYNGSIDIFVSKLDSNLSAIDADGDGYTSSVDCNDNDPSVNSGASEGPVGNATCSDGKDNDCNSFTDSADPNCTVSPPDLTISTWTAPANACAGATISIKDTTKNQGAGTAGASTTKFYLSTNTTLDPSDTPLGSRSVPSLGVGSLSTGTSSVTLPNVPTGKYYIIAMADDAKIISESNETNNKKTKVIYIGPDLIVSTLTAPISAARGTTITISATTKNKGCGMAVASTTAIYLSINRTLDTGDTKLCSIPVPSLSTGASSAGSCSGTIPVGIATGTYYIITNADDAKVVVESNETNNKRTKAITILP
ncbi:MAG: hypothetical protein A2W23_01090 [Planctomycetes bacterium RBG_16_43_13]|nr:MAG: hypothetical protein A2W23_01090 [Planctomycetes bacterium RBG_16_43_13]